MTVSELIELLQGHPQDKEVFLFLDNGEDVLGFYPMQPTDVHFNTFMNRLEIS